MGIYPDAVYKKHRKGEQETMHVTTSTPGLSTTEVYVKIAEFETRTDCFCCSCLDSYNDPACRNHGHAAKRPCEHHKMPGLEYEDGDMPVSVQQRIKSFREAAAFNLWY